MPLKYLFSKYEKRIYMEKNVNKYLSPNLNIELTYLYIDFVICTTRLIDTCHASSTCDLYKINVYVAELLNINHSMKLDVSKAPVNQKKVQKLHVGRTLKFW